MDEATMSELASTLAPDSDLLDLSDLPDFSGLPGDRLARMAARRAFVDMKLLFMRAVADLSDRKGQWLREKVRLATDPMDLWLLRTPVLAAVQGNDSTSRQLRAQLYRGLDSIFPEAFGVTGNMPMPMPPTARDPWPTGRGADIGWR
jgi:hypothetical protein